MNEEGVKVPLLTINDLRVEFPTYWGTVKALDGVTLEVNRGEIVGLVGESGCGKSVTAMTVMRLLPPGQYRIASGSVKLSGEELLTKTEREMETIRGKRLAMVFQEPMTSLNPTIRVGEQIAEVIRVHQGLSRAEAAERAAQLLHSMRIPDAERVSRQYPFQMSGGMRQRAMLAMALSCGPDLLVADEPTTALDVTVQAQVLRLIQQKSAELGTAVLFITHDFGVVAQVCRRVAVMYAGTVVEAGPVEVVLREPLHPYTRALLTALPERFSRDERLTVIPGSVPNLLHPPAGCRFEPRCPHGDEHCRASKPPTVSRPTGLGEHRVACWAMDGNQALAGAMNGGGVGERGR